MRWDIVKQAWGMAKQAFPSAGKIYVHIPSRFSAKGSCLVMDLEQDKSLGNIEYSIIGFGGKPTLVLQLGEQCKKASLDRVLIDMRTSFGETKPLKLGAKDIVSKCSDLVAIGKRAAALAIGHESSPLRETETVGRFALRAWMSKEGFPEDAVPYAEDELRSMGIAVSGFNFKDAKRRRKKEPLYQQQAVVRIVDPNMRDENKCGRVVQVVPSKGKDKKDKDKNFAYLILVNGTSAPVWFAEWQLAPNLAGTVPGVMPMGEMQNA